MQVLVLVLVLFFPSLSVFADVLESPAQGASLAGLGFIAGWKCDAGPITVRINGGAPIPIPSGLPRADTQEACGAENAGFQLQYDWNWLDAGAHTAVAYDDGVEFARSTFTVQSGQDAEPIQCAEDMRLHPGQSCTGTHGYHGHDYTFWVNQFSYSCAKGHIEPYEEGWCDPEYAAGYLEADQNVDGSWTIERVPHPDPDDHGDTPETATVVQLVPGSRLRETLWFSHGSDNDYFALEVPAGVQDRVLTITVNSRSMRASVFQIIGEGMYTNIADTDWDPRESVIHLQFPVSTGTYYLLLRFDYDRWHWDWDSEDVHLPHTATFHLAR